MNDSDVCKMSDVTDMNNYAQDGTVLSSGGSVESKGKDRITDSECSLTPQGNVEGLLEQAVSESVKIKIEDTVLVSMEDKWMMDYDPELGEDSREICMINP